MGWRKRIGEDANDTVEIEFEGWKCLILKDLDHRLLAREIYTLVMLYKHALFSSPVPIFETRPQIGTILKLSDCGGLAVATNHVSL